MADEADWAVALHHRGDHLADGDVVEVDVKLELGAPLAGRLAHVSADEILDEDGAGGVELERLVGGVVCLAVQDGEGAARKVAADGGGVFATSTHVMLSRMLSPIMWTPSQPR